MGLRRQMEWCERAPSAGLHAGGRVRSRTASLALPCATDAEGETLPGSVRERRWLIVVPLGKSYGLRALG